MNEKEKMMLPLKLGEFQALTGSIREAHRQEGIPGFSASKTIAMDMVLYFGRINPKFDNEQFLTACGFPHTRLLEYKAIERDAKIAEMEALNDLNLEKIRKLEAQLQTKMMKESFDGKRVEKCAKCGNPPDEDSCEAHVVHYGHDFVRAKSPSGGEQSEEFMKWIKQAVKFYEQITPEEVKRTYEATHEKKER
jgi:hypothetical protein